MTSASTILSFANILRVSVFGGKTRSALAVRMLNNRLLH
jgi:hypothetical protein